MEIGQLKEKFSSVDSKIKFLVFLGIALILAVLPETWILLLGALILIYFKALLSGFFYLFSTTFRIVLTLVLLLFALYLIMLIVVYFFT